MKAAKGDRMAAPFLTIKLYIPPVRPEMISRPRLIERLNAGLAQNQGFGCKLTLISAPAVRRPTAAADSDG